MGIEQAIKSWDGKSSSNINAIYDRHGSNDDFVRIIIQFSGEESLQKGATWLLKRHFENNHRIEEDQVTKIFELLPKLEHWEAKLHILQCISYMGIANTGKKQIELFLRKCLTDENKFVRAWAYNGFYELSMQHSEYITETKHLLEMAMRDEAPSVKARIRNILKKPSNKAAVRNFKKWRRSRHF